MPEIPVIAGQPRFSTLRRLARGARTQKRERCDLCGEALPTEHRHLLDIATRQVACACRGCVILFATPAAGAGVRRLIPEQAKILADFHITDRQWDNLRLPVNMAFFFRSTPAGRVIALYPSPAGATESLLEMDAWKELESQNPILKTMETDVEALLVNRVRGANRFFIAPIDECFKLVGLIRMYWRGLSGGNQVWDEINTFFEILAERSQTIPGGESA
jgi:hypothetical protein